MAWANVQVIKVNSVDVSGGGASTQTGAWTTANLTAGNRILLGINAVTDSNSTIVVDTPTDTAGTTFTRLVTNTSTKVSSGGLIVSEIWTATTTTGAGTKPTISVTVHGGNVDNSVGWVAVEYSGCDTSAGTGCLDTSGVRSDDNIATDMTVTTGLATAAGELIFSFIGDWSGATWTVAASTPTLTKNTAISYGPWANGSAAVAEGTSTNGATSSCQWHDGATNSASLVTAIIKLASVVLGPQPLPPTPTAYATESFHGALTANVVTTKLFAREHIGVEIASLDGAAAIYGTLDGTVPTVGAANTFCLPAVAGSMVIRFPKPWPVPSDPTVQVKLISIGTPAYQLTGIDA